MLLVVLDSPAERQALFTTLHKAARHGPNVEWDDSPNASLDSAWLALNALNHALGLERVAEAMPDPDTPLTVRGLSELLHTVLASVEAEIRERDGTDTPCTC